MPYIPPRLQELADQLRQSESPRSETVRSFLSWFGAERRGYWILQRIRTALNEVGVRTQPDFESAYIDGLISFRLVVPPVVPTEDAPSSPVLSQEESIPDTVSVKPPVPVIGGAVSDPTYRIGKLAQANRTPIAVSPDCPLREAITLMLVNDFSQLPVWQNERTVKGIVSWASIGARIALDRPATIVRECMEPFHEVSSDDSLFAALPTIIRHQYVLIRGSDQRITGIVTTSDLSVQFQLLAEPFLLLGEIENHIRRLIDGKFTSTELIAVKDPSDEGREVSSVADLSFGEHVRLLENPDNWLRVGIGVDRATFIKELDKIRLIRNDVMHFDPDGIADDDLQTLRGFVSFLQKLRDIGAM